VTSSVSGKRSPAELIALHHSERSERPYCEVGTGFEPVYTALQAVASPLGHPTAEATQVTAWTSSSGRRDSNPRPSPWQGDALPTALRPLASRPGRAARPGNCIRTSRRAPNGPYVSEFRRRSARAKPGGYPTPRWARVRFPSPGATCRLAQTVTARPRPGRIDRSAMKGSGLERVGHRNRAQLEIQAAVLHLGAERNELQD
jgi:hypothetical protein